MSRSYRKPYSSFCGHDPDDKRVARRGWRHVQNQALRETAKNETDWDEFLIPDIYEAPYNDVWGWGRDGNQSLQKEPEWTDYLYWFHSGYWTDEEALELANEYFAKAQKWYAKLCRK
jgi:hypothetical protein